MYDLVRWYALTDIGRGAMKRYRLLLTVSEFMFSSQVRNLCDLASGLDRDLFDIEIGALSVGDEATAEIEATGVPYQQLMVHPPRRPDLKRLSAFVKSPLIVHRKKYDLVHALLYQSFFTDPLIIKTFSRAKYVYTKSNNRWSNHPINWHIKSRLADRIISISRSTDEVLIKHGFGDKIARIFLGIDTRRFAESAEKRRAFRTARGLPADTLVFGCAAQFIEWKNHLVLIEAFEHLCSQHNDLILLLCGPHHDDDFYERFTRRLAGSPARDKVHLLGTLDDMPSFYSAIDVFVLPSRTEPFGYVYIEAMSCSKPVIATRAGGPLDIIVEDENGYFTEMSSAPDLASQMMKYVDDPSLIAQHGRAGRRRVERLFSAEVMVKNHQDLYLEMLGAR